MPPWPADADRHPLVWVETAPESEVDFVAVFLDDCIGSDGSTDARVDSSTGWYNAIGENDACVHSVDRHRPAVARDVPVQLVEGWLVAFGEEEPDRVGNVVPDDDCLIRIASTRNPDAERARPTGVLSFLFDAKPPAFSVGDVADGDVELRLPTLRGVVAERKVADDSVPLTVESDRQLLSDVERSVGVNCEERIERADANGAALRARIAREREDPNQERETATNR